MPSDNGKSQSFDGAEAAQAIERQKVPNADYEYYFHYSKLNSRVDEWVRVEQLHLDSVEAVVDERMEEKVRQTGFNMTRHKKRKIDQTHVEGHQEFHS
ncbi:hypothetical protein VNO80_12891 [Phaseolus coccineus]|uniref:Tudor-knot domain-containing protein n=1 Tax=Phaseolus coccineus TaxID=3886 RepID=A0AAN9N5H9_PHACN